MRMALLLLLVLLIAGCGSAAAAPAGSTETRAPISDPTAACTEAYDIASTPGTAFEDVPPDAVVAFPPPGVTFSATVERSGDAVRIEGVLRNGSDASVPVDYLTGGVMGISTNPFQVDIDVQPRTATGPEIYPTPRRAVLPPRGEIMYSVRRCPTFPARVRWTFTPWRGDAVQGDVVVR